MNTHISLPAESQPYEQKQRAVRRLPAPQPGIEITVPLELWPLYMQLHGIEPAGCRYPTLLVKKVEAR